MEGGRDGVRERERDELKGESASGLGESFLKGPDCTLKGRKGRKVLRCEGDELVL